MNIAMRKTVAVAGIAFACVSITVGVTPVAAGSTGGWNSYRVEGTQTEEQEGTMMNSNTGRTGLSGSWVNLGSVPRFGPRGGLYVETGTELFDGCLDVNGSNRCEDGEPSGRMTFDYTYWLRYDVTAPPDKALIEGRCVHPITGGDGGFAGARGVITMRDRWDDQGLHTTYRGSLALGRNGVSTGAEQLSVESAVQLPAPVGAVADSSIQLPKAC